MKEPKLSKILLYLRPYLFTVILTLMAILVSRVAAAVEPIYLKRIIDYISVHPRTDLGTARGLIALMVLFFTFRLVAFLFEFIRDYIFSPVEMGVSRDLAHEIFNRLVSLPIDYYYEQKTGTLARRISRGTSSLTFLLDFLVINILPTFFELIFVSILLFSLYPVLYGLITFFTVIGYAAFTVFATELRQKYRLGANVADDEASAVQVETIYNIETIKYFGNEEFQRKKFFDRIGDWYRFSVRSNQLFGAISAGQSFILMLGFGLIIYFSIKSALIGDLTIGDLVLLSTYVVRLAAPITSLGFVYRRIKDSLIDLSLMTNILDQKQEPSDSPSAKIILQLEGRVQFRDVSLKYGNRTALRGLSFEIPSGKRVAIVGPSGAGKSTIVKLLFRLHDPGAGQILIDGVDLRQLRSSQRHNLIALVPQEPILFNDSIRQNILFGKPNASKAELERVIGLSYLEELIKNLPEGLETIVGERGIKLSGGEKQRIAIARAIIKDPKILVFDEATSNLDAESEQEILKAIRQVSAGRTTISIAHRLPTITDNDIIFVVEKGKLAEQGTHEELLALDGLYARLWRRFVK